MKRAIYFVLTVAALFLATSLVLGAENGPTIAQIHADSNAQSFWDFLWAMRKSIEVQILEEGVMVIPVAMLCSYWAKWGFKVIDRNVGLLDYFWRQDPQRTVGAFISAFSIIAGGAFTGAFSTDANLFVGWYNVLYATFLAGLGSDGMINKAARSAWTEEMRTARKGN
jgi:hypothetical protein